MVYGIEFRWQESGLARLLVKTEVDVLQRFVGGEESDQRRLVVCIRESCLKNFCRLTRD